MFQALQKRSVSDEVFDQLRDRIVSRELNAGDELPSERLLSEMLGVSRNAVREAIKRLQQARLVEVKQGGLTTVLDYRAEAGAELLPHLLFDRDGQIQIEVARSIVRMRQVLSPEIAADAAIHGSAEIADQLDDLVEQMRQSEHALLTQQLALNFWDVLVSASGNIAYRLAFNSLRKTYEPLLGVMTDLLAQQQQQLPVFIELARCVRESLREAAERCARAYIDESSAVIVAFLDQYQDRSESSAESKQ